MPETVLVTGGTGFVGGWCVAELLKRGYNVRTTVRSEAKKDTVRQMMAKAGVDAANLSFAIADLNSDDGWAGAMQGVDYLLHVASPLATGDTSDIDAFVKPAREGTLRVLRAAVDAGVKRVVLTSSAAAANPGIAGDSYTDETVWTDPALWKNEPYRLSKVLAERAAWDFIQEHAGTTELVTILPTGILGPVLRKEDLGSVQTIDRMLNGALPRIPRFGFCVIDVRDLADAHIKAMTTPEAAGERLFITGEFLWMADMAKLLRDNLGASASKVPTKTMPDFVMRLASAFQKELRAMTPLLGRKNRYSWEKAKRVIGFEPRPASQTVIDTAKALLAD